jgi:hypothetical protein
VDDKEFEVFRGWCRSRFADTPNRMMFTLYDEWVKAGRPARHLLPGENVTWTPERSLKGQLTTEDIGGQ